MYVQTKLDLMDLDKNDFKLENRLIINNEEGNFLLEIKESLESCISFYFSVAFVNFSGLQLILEDLKKASERGVKGKLLTSTYLNFTEAYALKKIKEFNNVDLNIFITEEKNRGFHTKAYIFEYEDNFKIYIGSSNLTQGALKSNEEWNVLIVEKKDEDFSKKVMESFNRLFNESLNVTDEFIEDYEALQKELLKEKENPLLEKYEKIKPNLMQKEALINLERLRLHGGERGIVVAATGTGKTYMSAFDVQK
ncbi:MAG: phospholipase D-like domain-containing protein, partial [Clostridium sp.]|uniref:phospholipase D-like domain-containing protein n=1 Tax=Clostridium sp. TaxID=1506 RepID=UPI003F322C2A